MSDDQKPKYTNDYKPESASPRRDSDVSNPDFDYIGEVAYRTAQAWLPGQYTASIKSVTTSEETPGVPQIILVIEAQWQAP
jgi:hypothetical protein